MGLLRAELTLLSKQRQSNTMRLAALALCLLTVGGRTASGARQMPKEYGTVGPRSIYPEMCDSRSLARCGLLANALWPRLVAQSDDQGRLHGDALDIAGVCFPKMAKVHRHMEAALEELAVQKSITRYEVDGEPYIQITEWWSYQGHQRRAYPSRYPAPEGWEDRVYGITRQPAADSGETPPDAPHNSGTRGDLPPSLARPSPSLSSPSGPSPTAPPAGAKTNGSKTPDEEVPFVMLSKEEQAAALQREGEELTAKIGFRVGVKVEP